MRARHDAGLHPEAFEPRPLSMARGIRAHACHSDERRRTGQRGFVQRAIRPETRFTMQVQQIMTRKVELTDPNTTVRDVARKMRADNIGALPVGENDRLVGMVTDRDILTRAVAEERAPGNTSVREVMSEHVYYCFDDDDVEQAAQIMAEHQVRRLPVLNRNKRLVGVVALADLGRSGTDAVKRALKGISEPTDQPRR
jgi:CBS domain-containing protein